MKNTTLPQLLLITALFMASCDKADDLPDVTLPDPDPIDTVTTITKQEGYIKFLVDGEEVEVTNVSIEHTFVSYYGTDLFWIHGDLDSDDDGILDHMISMYFKDESSGSFSHTDTLYQVYYTFINGLIANYAYFDPSYTFFDIINTGETKGVPSDLEYNINVTKFDNSANGVVKGTFDARLYGEIYIDETKVLTSGEFYIRLPEKVE